jgi:outer membrane immunogenic protein
MATAFIAALALSATPAFAGDFSGPRLEVTAGADDVKNGVDTTDITYGAALGYDLQFGKVVAGVDATAANVFDKADLGVGARLGYVVNENVLAFTRVGYTNLERPRVCIGTRPVICRNDIELEGLTLGGGLEVNVAGPVYGKLEYRYTDFDAGLGRHGALAGVGIRF